MNTFARFTILPLAVLFLVLFGCLSPVSRLEWLDSRKDPIESSALRVIPPPGPAWGLRHNSALPHLELRGVLFWRLIPLGQMVFGRDLVESSPQRTYRATVTEYQSDRDFVSGKQFINLQLNGLNEPFDSQGYLRKLNFSSKESSCLKAPCISFYYEANGRGSPAHPRQEFLFHAWGCRCLHPNNNRLVVDVTYSERFAAGDRPTLTEADAAAFFSGIKFKDMK